MENPRRRPLRRRPVSPAPKAPGDTPSTAIPPKVSTSEKRPPISGLSRPPVVQKSSKMNSATVAFIILSLLLLGTSLFLYKNRKDVEKKLTLEKEELLRNFEDIRQKLDIVSINNNQLKDSLSITSSMISSYMDSLQKTRMTARALRRYRRRFLSIRKDNQITLKINDSLIRLVSSLTEERNSLITQLKKQISINDSLQKSTSLLKRRMNSIIGGGNGILPDGNNSVELALNKISITAISISKKGKESPQKKVKKAKKLKICFTISKNSNVQKSRNYTLYIKVKDSKGKVMGGKRIYKKKDKKIQYSIRSKFYYEKNNDLDVCEYASRGKRKFKSGNYKIEIYNNNANKIASYSKTL